MLALLPVIEQNPMVEQAAERMVAAGRNRVVFLLRMPADRERPRDALAAISLRFNDRLSASRLFTNEPAAEPVAASERQRLFDHRYHLLTLQQARAIELNPEQLIESALSGLYGLLGAFQARQLTTDPLGLHADYLRAFAPPGFDLLNATTPAFIADEHIHTVHVATTRAAGFDLTSQAQLLDFIVSSRVWATQNRVELLVTGLPVFAAEGAKSARFEISLFGTVSILGILALLIGVFRSPRPIVLTILSIGSGVGCAFVTTTLVFGKIHILTLVFGCSLIGISIDYALHYLCDAFRDGDWTPASALRRVLPGITVALLTSVCAFLSFLATPFPGLQQMAIFSASGLAAAWFTVVTLYPSLGWSKPPQRKPALLRVVDTYLAQFSRPPGSRAPGTRVLVLLAIVVPAIVLGLSKIAPDDNIRVLQSAPDALLSQDNRIRTLLPQQFDSQFYLINAASIEAVLAAERRLGTLLDEAVAARQVAGYRMLSNVYPDLQQQQANYQLVKSQLYDSGRITNFYESIGLTAQEIEAHRLSFAAADNSGLPLADWLHGTPGDWRRLSLGCAQESSGKQCGSVVQLAGIRSLTALGGLAEKLEGVTFIDQIGDLSSLLGRYREVATLILLAVYSLISLALCWRFGVRPALSIIFVPACAVITAMAVIGWSGNPFSLFNLFALLLVVGISIDYAVFFHLSGRENRTTALAVLLSAATTIMAFGLLTFSATTVINTFGLTLLAGIGSAFLLAPLASANIRSSLFGRNNG